MEVLSDEQMWDNLQYFLEQSFRLPKKQMSNWQCTLMIRHSHPSADLPGLCAASKIIRNCIDLIPSPVNGIALCQGNFTLMTDDLPAAIRHFGKQNKIFFVHFRDVRGTPEKFVETFHDDGKTDMLECLRAYRDVGYEGVCRPDHVPTMEGDTYGTPGYTKIGRLFAIGYIKGLREAVYRES